MDTPTTHIDPRDQVTLVISWEPLTTHRPVPESIRQTVYDLMYTKPYQKPETIVLVAPDRQRYRVIGDAKLSKVTLIVGESIAQTLQ